LFPLELRIIRGFDVKHRLFLVRVKKNRVMHRRNNKYKINKSAV